MKILLAACILGMAVCAPPQMFMEFDIHHAPAQVHCSQLMPRDSLWEDLSMASSNKRSSCQMAETPRRFSSPSVLECQILLVLVLLQTPLPPLPLTLLQLLLCLLPLMLLQPLLLLQLLLPLLNLSLLLRLLLPNPTLLMMMMTMTKTN
ncbi:hypothetical protein INR49_025768 [Caranx melampygus]|nr:hypothetical protein INR49_025768 [Caranx melampygus]